LSKVTALSKGLSKSTKQHKTAHAFTARLLPGPGGRHQSYPARKKQQQSSEQRHSPSRAQRTDSIPEPFPDGPENKPADNQGQS